MKNVSQIKLSEFFNLFAPTHVLGTTYTISLAFFESVVFPFIKKNNLKKCLIICDRIGFQRVTDEAVALLDASLSYVALTAPTAHSFHPKVWIMMNEDEVALLAGSGNLTQSGFMHNVELFDIVRIQKNQIGPKIILHDIHKFLNGLLNLWDEIPDVSFIALDTLNEMINLCEDISREVENDALEEIRFLSSFQESNSLIEQLPPATKKANSI